MVHIGKVILLGYVATFYGKMSASLGKDDSASWKYPVTNTGLKEIISGYITFNGYIWWGTTKRALWEPTVTVSSTVTTSSLISNNIIRNSLDGDPDSSTAATFSPDVSFSKNSSGFISFEPILRAVTYGGSATTAYYYCRGPVRYKFVGY